MVVDTTDMGLNMIKIAILAMIGFIIASALFGPTLPEIERQCNICIQEPYLSILTGLIIGIIGMLIVGVILGGKQDEKKKPPVKAQDR